MRAHRHSTLKMLKNVAWVGIHIGICRWQYMITPQIPWSNGSVLPEGYSLSCWSWHSYLGIVYIYWKGTNSTHGNVRHRSMLLRYVWRPCAPVWSSETSHWKSHLSTRQCTLPLLANCIPMVGWTLHRRLLSSLAGEVIWPQSHWAHLGDYRKRLYKEIFEPLTLPLLAYNLFEL